MFIARNRFAVLDKASGQIQVRNLQNEITKKCAPPCSTTDAVFYAGTGLLLCRSEDKVRCCLASCCLKFNSSVCLDSDIVKGKVATCSTTYVVSYAGSGLLLCRSEDKVSRDLRLTLSHICELL